ncbi:MAG: DUF308 domain-containing protein [Clostridia bacterium]|nr:DUF308 domain-containing protein [Clostridia bacterium]
MSEATILNRVNQIGSEVSALSNQVGSLSTQTNRIDSNVSAMRQELDQLRTDFQKLMQEQQRSAALQRAISELVRVRQEISDKYGNYTVVRQTMLGVLQATDVALVKKSTISRVSEELMLSTPQYWLAPCLVAVSGWIANDRSLAERAIAEAMRRDSEKTALAMALICRRNGRIDTGFEWLSIYFSKQSAASITEETFTYIDAYINGVFGPDEKHRCQGYITKWIDEIRNSDSGFEEAQESKWESYFSTYKVDTRPSFPFLSTVKEFPQIDKCIGGLSSFGTVRGTFREISEAFIDQEEMKKTVDKELIHLISNYDKAEVEIRREEEYLQLVKSLNGDEAAARSEMVRREALRQQKKMDFIEQMAAEITAQREGSPSKRRTAVTFLSNYINRGYDRYIASARESFPKQITIDVNGWSGVSTDGSEAAALTASYEQAINSRRQEEIHRTFTRKPLLMLIFAIIFVVLGAAGVGVGLAIARTLVTVLGGVFVLTGIGLFIGRISLSRKSRWVQYQLNNDFDTQIEEGRQRIGGVLTEWRTARSTIKAFDENGDHKVA